MTLACQRAAARRAAARVFWVAALAIVGIGCPDADVPPPTAPPVQRPLAVEPPDRRSLYDEAAGVELAGLGHAWTLLEPPAVGRLHPDAVLGAEWPNEECWGVVLVGPRPKDVAVDAHARSLIFELPVAESQLEYLDLVRSHETKTARFVVKGRFAGEPRRCQNSVLFRRTRAYQIIACSGAAYARGARSCLDRFTASVAIMPDP